MQVQEKGEGEMQLRYREFQKYLNKEYQGVSKTGICDKYTWKY